MKSLELARRASSGYGFTELLHGLSLSPPGVVLGDPPYNTQTNKTNERENERTHEREKI